MPMVHLNRSLNKGVTISSINRRMETITGLQVRLGKVVLRLGEEVPLGKAFLCLSGLEINQEGVLGLPKRIDLCLCEAPFS